MFTKADMVPLVAKAAGITKERASKVLDELTEGFAASLVAGEVVELFRLGRLTPYVRSARKGINLKTGEPVAIPPTVTVKFGPSTSMKVRLNPDKKGGEEKTSNSKPATEAKATGKAPPAAKAEQAGSKTRRKEGDVKTRFKKNAQAQETEAGQPAEPPYEPLEKMFDPRD